MGREQNSEETDMTQLLLRLFVKNQDTNDPENRAAVGTLSGVVSILANLLLFGGKVVIGTISGSVAITADAMNNLSDASSAVVTMLGLRLAQRPADEDHPYGYARWEYLSGLAVAAMILLIGFELVKTSAAKILDPTPVSFSWLPALVLVGSIAVKLWMCLFNTKLGDMIHSTTLHATAADSRNDCVATGAVLVASVIEAVFDLRVDGFIGLAVALFILYSGAQLARDTISPLLGENASPELCHQIVGFIGSQPKVLGYHDLMVHDYGPGQRFASLHVEMDKREDVMECHERIDEMERQCLKLYNVHLVIHYDPVVTDDPLLNELKAEASQHLKEADERLTLHDFRMVPGKRHTNLVFDVALPSDLRGKEEMIRRTVEQAMNEEGKDLTYHIVITFDAAQFNA